MANDLIPKTSNSGQISNKMCKSRTEHRYLVELGSHLPFIYAFMNKSDRFYASLSSKKSLFAFSAASAAKMYNGGLRDIKKFRTRVMKLEAKVKILSVHKVGFCKTSYPFKNIAPN